MGVRVPYRKNVNPPPAPPSDLSESLGIFFILSMGMVGHGWGNLGGTLGMAGGTLGEPWAFRRFDKMFDNGFDHIITRLLVYVGNISRRFDNMFDNLFD